MPRTKKEGADKVQQKKAITTNLELDIYHIIATKCEIEGITIADAVREGLYIWSGLRASPLEVAKLLKTVEEYKKKNEQLEDKNFELEADMEDIIVNNFLPQKQINLPLQIKEEIKIPA